MNDKLADEIERRGIESCVHLQAAIIAALRRSQPEGMVMVPREPTQAMMEAAKPAFATIDAWCAEMQLARGRKPDWPENDPPLKQAWRLMLPAAEAEVRKPCPLCGRTEPHSHTSGPLGMS